MYVQTAGGTDGEREASAQQGIKRFEFETTMDDEFGASPLGRSKQRRQSTTATATATQKSLEFVRDRDGNPDEQHNDMDDVLYGDLLDPDQPSTSQSIHATHATTLLKLKTSKLQSELAASEENVKVLQEEVATLRAVCEELREKNGNLEYNISSLFNTAKLEIERKDKEIKRLRSETQHSGHGGSQRGQGSQRDRDGSHRRSSSHGGGRASQDRDKRR